MAAAVTPLFAGLGHNQPPPDETLPDPHGVEALRTRLAADHADLMRRFVELEQGAARLPETVEDEAAAARIVDFVGEQCQPAIAAAKAAHDEEKRPHLERGRTVDRFFLRRIEAFNIVVTGVAARAAAFHDRLRQEQRQRDEETRRRARQEERRQAVEAARLAAAAKAEKDRAAAAELGRQAEEARTRAAAAQALSEAAPSPVRLRGDYGGTGYTRQELVIEVDDPTLIPLQFLTLDESAVRAAWKAGTREIPGLVLTLTDRFTIRGAS